MITWIRHRDSAANQTIYDVIRDIGFSANYLMNYYDSPMHREESRFEFSEIFTDEGICFAFNDSRDIYTGEFV